MARTPAVLLAPGVWRVPLLRDFINGFVFRDDDGQVTLLDMGLKGHGPKLLAALESIGSGPSDVTRLLLSHAHPDHLGGTAHVAKETGLAIEVHADDAAYVRRGEIAPQVAVGLLGRLLHLLTPEQKLEPLPVAAELTDGQVLPVAGGLRVLHMPGHSPGHAGFLHEPSGVLVTGDAIMNPIGLRWSPKSVCSDYRMSERTAHRLAELDYRVAAFTHGPEVRDRPREHIRRFLARHGT
ncbi:MBL fold metallo-hydrolase [Nocardioides sp.]|uniref:MBL fold metallo-hydrolase n=1 Tax=Nocardioides sp. TaxID=35761 RepID=UPI002ED07D1C